MTLFASSGYALRVIGRSIGTRLPAWPSSTMCMRRRIRVHEGPLGGGSASDWWLWNPYRDSTHQEKQRRNRCPGPCV